MSSIRFERVGREFRIDGKPFTAVQDVDLTIEDGEFTAIVGPSGCGKTTCLRMVAGLETPTQGTVSVDGTPVIRPAPSRAVVFQQFALFPWMSVAQNITFGLRNLKVPSDRREQTVRRYIELMHLSGYENAMPHQLSGGMQQRVAIARAYALQPQVLLMDEPFGALDAQTRTVMQEDLVRTMAAEHRTALFITHSVEEAVYLADRVIVMTRRPGRIKEIVDIAPIRRQERWRDLARIEDVMDLESFAHLRNHIWKSLREEK